jgi:DNA-binding response OmpR family regulator
MAVSSSHETPSADSASLSGLHILLVEDSWHVGAALNSLLQALGASVAGPAATTADADQLIDERIPDVAIVDFSLRGGEHSGSLIERLSSLGVHIIVISGYEEVPLAGGISATVLQKPIVESQLIAALRPVLRPAR